MFSLSSTRRIYLNSVSLIIVIIIIRFYRQSARVAPKYKFTQLSSASRLSTRYWCSVGPKPDGDANCLTMAFVRSYCCCGKIGSSARKYSDIVCSSGGTGSFGKSCNENQQQKIEMRMKYNYITESFESFDAFLSRFVYAIQLSYTFDDKSNKRKLKQ